MKDRIITLCGALLTLYLVIALLVPKPATQQNTSWPTSEDKGRFGLNGLKQWLDNSNIKTYSLRQRYQHLQTTPDVKETGNLLIISVPQKIPAQHKERKALLQWLENGNTILLMAAYDDLPFWSRTTQFDRETLPKALGIDFEMDTLEEDEDESENKEKTEAKSILETIKTLTETLEEKEQEYRPIGHHPVLSNVDTIKVHANIFGESNYNPIPENEDHLMIALAQETTSQHAGFWLLQRSCCRIWIFNHADVFGNETLGFADNARLFGNILSLSKTTGGSVIFDDMHQGLANFYDPETFFTDPRLYKTILFMLMLWLFYILGHTNRFGPVAKQKRINNSLEFVRAMGGLFARNMDTKVIAKRLLEHFNNEYRSKRGMPVNSKPVWDSLNNNPAIDKTTLHALQTNYVDLDTGKKVNLITIFNQIQKIRRIL